MDTNILHMEDVTLLVGPKLEPYRMRKHDPLLYGFMKTSFVDGEVLE